MSLSSIGIQVQRFVQLITTVTGSTAKDNDNHHAQNEDDLLSKYKELEQLIRGPISITKDKIHTVNTTKDIDSLLPNLGPKYKEDLKNHLVNLYDDEVDNCMKILFEIQEILSKLENIVDIIDQRLSGDLNSRNNNLKSEPSYYPEKTCFNDCNKILTYFRLKFNILKHFLATPLESQSKDPFAHCPDFIERDGEAVLWLISKLEVQKFEPLPSSITSSDRS